MAPQLRTLDDLDVAGKRVLCRVDFNCPMSKGKVIDDNRIRAFLPTLEALRERGARVVLISHLGRPNGKKNSAMSLLPIGARLASLTDAEVVFAHDTSGDEVVALTKELQDGGVLLAENLRFDPREKAGDDDFAKELAAMGDVFVNDAFGAMHRSHASVTGIPQHLPSAVGKLVEAELAVLGRLVAPEATGRTPFGAVLGGSKVSDKIGVIESLSRRIDFLFIGGAMAYTFLAAIDQPIGDSRVESDKLDLARKLLEKCEDRNVKVFLPEDHVAATAFEETAEPLTVDALEEGMMGLDIGPVTVKSWSKTLKRCSTVFWNGPLGVFEWNSFAGGTQGVAEVLGALPGTTIIGGGDSAAAAAKFGLADAFDHVSTGGGACLDFLENGDLVGLAAIRKGS